MQGAPHQPSAVELEVRRGYALLDGRRSADALAAAEALLVRVPENRDVLLLRALARRRLNDPVGALAALEPLERLHPNFSRLYQERGDCHVALRQAPQAIAAFERAVELNAALAHSWRMLEGLYRLSGQGAPAAAAAARATTLEQLPPQLLAAKALFGDGELGAAEQLARAFLAGHGAHVEALHLLARIAIASDALEVARPLLEALLERVPEHRAARWDYAQLFFEQHLYLPALAHVDRLLAADPDNRDYQLLQARCYVGLGRHQPALARFRELLPGAAQAAELHLAIGHTLKTLGRSAEAVAAYRAAAAARADFGDAYWSLANLKTYRFTDRELEFMRAAEIATTTAAADRCALCFALGKALEDRAQYAASFDYYRRGNVLRRAAQHHDPDRLEREVHAQIAVCGPQLFARHRDGGAPDRDPIFIVGLPRSGSTLVEQILASHPAVEGTQELADLPRLVSQLPGDHAPGALRYPALLAQLSAADLRRLGAQYLEETRAYRTGKPRFIDKMPNNFRHVGLLHLLLPNAVIIDVRREPLACCFGIYKQLFARGHDFAYDLADIALHYRSYLELMRHWDTVLPGRVLRVHYEDLVTDLEGSVRRLLGHCGLGFDPACLEFHRNARSVHTASAEQVRQPLYRDGLEQWRNFEPWLGPLRAALGDALSRYRD